MYAEISHQQRNLIQNEEMLQEKTPRESENQKDMMTFYSIGHLGSHGMVFDVAVVTIELCSVTLLFLKWSFVRRALKLLH